MLSPGDFKICKYVLVLHQILDIHIHVCFDTLPKKIPRCSLQITEQNNAFMVIMVCFL